MPALHMFTTEVNSHVPTADFHSTDTTSAGRKSDGVKASFWQVQPVVHRPNRILTFPGAGILLQVFDPIRRLTIV